MKPSLAVVIAGFGLTVLGFVLLFGPLKGSGTLDSLPNLVVFAMIVLGPVIAVSGLMVFALQKASSTELSDTTRPPRSKRVSGWLAAVAGGFVGLLMGLLLAVMLISPGSAAGTEAMMYAIGPALGAIIGAPAGLVGVLLLRRRG